MTGWPPLLIDGPAMARRELVLPVVDALAEAFRAVRSGEVRIAPRTLLCTDAEPANQLLVSPAVWERRQVAGLKLTTLTPGNPARGLPLIHGVVVLVDTGTGRISALLDGAELTAVRTGAVAGLATRLCAPPDAADLAVIGAGAQARALLRTMAVVRPPREVRLHSRTAARAEAFAGWARDLLGPRVRVTVCATVREAVRDAAIVCTATATDATAPLVEADWVAPGAHLNVIGGTHEDAVEVAPSLLADAFVVVEERAAALAEAGEIRAAVAAGLLDPAAPHEIGALLDGTAVPPPGRTTLLRGVGLAVEDTAAAAAVYAAVSGGG